MCAFLSHFCEICGKRTGRAAAPRFFLNAGPLACIRLLFFPAQIFLRPAQYAAILLIGKALGGRLHFDPLGYGHFALLGHGGLLVGFSTSGRAM